MFGEGWTPVRRRRRRKGKRDLESGGGLDVLEGARVEYPINQKKVSVVTQ